MVHEHAPSPTVFIIGRESSAVIPQTGYFCIPALRGLYCLRSRAFGSGKVLTWLISRVLFSDTMGGAPLLPPERGRYQKNAGRPRMNLPDLNELRESESESDRASPPLVSVVIPAYNASGPIVETLNSVFRQAFSGFEVIVVNDGSPDTRELESALQPFAERIRYFQQQPNRGPSSARNLGILQARGRYVAFLDSDDLWLPHHLASQLALFAGNHALGLVYSNNLQLQGEEIVGAAFDSVPQNGPVTLESLLAEDCTVNTSSVLVLRSALLECGLFDETMNRCEDFDLWVRLAAHGVRMAYDGQVQVIHRLGNGLSSNSELMKRGRAAVYRKAAATLQLNPAQREIIHGKLRQLEIEIEIETAKQHLDAGRFREARSAVQHVNSMSGAAKFRVAAVALLYCPRLLRWSYRGYIRFLQWYKRRARAPGRNPRTPLNTDALMRQRQA